MLPYRQVQNANCNRLFQLQPIAKCPPAIKMDHGPRATRVRAPVGCRECYLVSSLWGSRPDSSLEVRSQPELRNRRNKLLPLPEKHRTLLPLPSAVEIRWRNEAEGQRSRTTGPPHNNHHFMYSYMIPAASARVDLSR